MGLIIEELVPVPIDDPSIRTRDPIFFPYYSVKQNVLAVDQVVPMPREDWDLKTRDNWADFRPFYPKKPLNAAMQQFPPHQVTAEIIARTSDNGWDQFRLFWKPAVSPANPLSVELIVPMPREDWDLKTRDEWSEFRPFYPKGIIANALAVDIIVPMAREDWDLKTRDEWSEFRPFYPKGPTPNFFAIDIIVPMPREDWDLTTPDVWSAYRPFLHQGKLIVATQVEKGGVQPWERYEGYRRVSEDVWAIFRPYWKPPPVVSYVKASTGTGQLFTPKYRNQPDIEAWTLLHGHRHATYAIRIDGGLRTATNGLYGRVNKDWFSLHAYVHEKLARAILGRSAPSSLVADDAWGTEKGFYDWHQLHNLMHKELDQALGFH